MISLSVFLLNWNVFKVTVVFPPNSLARSVPPDFPQTLDQELLEA